MTFRAIRLPQIILLSLAMGQFYSCCTCGQTDPQGEAGKPVDAAQNGDRNIPFNVPNTCTYTQFQGTAQILAVKWINESRAEVTFTFSLSDPKLKDTYRFPRMGDAEIKKLVFLDAAEGGKLLSQLQAGEVIPCLRSEIISGTCTPVVFSFPGLESH